VEAIGALVHPRESSNSAIFRPMSTRVTGFVLLLCLLFTVAPLSAQDDDGQPAPRFTAKTTTGEKFSNESLKGKVVLLQFWTTWCQYCRREQKFVDALDKELASKGLIVLAINVGESKKTVNKYLLENPRNVKIVLNDDTNLAAMFAAKSYPIYVAIDKEGRVAGTQRGAGGDGSLRNLVRRAGMKIEDDE
jgi:thiol-disulfide isomerase/thioredoxin